MMIRDYIKPCKITKADADYSPYIEIGDIDVETKEYGIKNKKAVTGSVISSYGDILVSTVRPTRGAITVVKEVKAAVSSAFAIIRPDQNKCEPRYLFYCLNSKPFLEFLGKNSKGATYPTCSKEDVFNYPIKDRDKLEQLEIVKKLDSLTSIIRNRKAELQTLDNLIKARFVEMFRGSNCPSVELIDLITEGSGLSYGIVQPGDDGTGDMGVLRPVDMVNGKISFSSIKYINRAIGDGFKKTELTGDELLITVRGTTGITALTDMRFKGMNVTRGIAVIRFDRRKINPVYLNAYLNTEESQRYIQEHTRGATLQQINLADLRVQRILVPSMELQEEFSAFATLVDKSKFVVQQALEKSQLLFDSLMQKYFDSE